LDEVELSRKRVTGDDEMVVISDLWRLEEIRAEWVRKGRTGGMMSEGGFGFVMFKKGAWAA
jgi:hypothetical protein